MKILKAKIEYLPRINRYHVKKLHKLGIYTLYDLLFYFPHRYEDFSHIVPINQLEIEQTATIQGQIIEIENRRSFRRKMIITEAIIQDETGAIKAIWFNQPFLAQSLSPGQKVSLAGKVVLYNESICLSNPIYEFLSQEAKNIFLTHTGKLIPIYHETYGLTSKYLRSLIKSFLPLADRIKDYLPEIIKKRQKLIDINTAVKQIHFPKDYQWLEKARNRLSFDELFLIQLTALKQKKELQKEKAFAIPFNKNLIQKFVKNLPFKLTNSQKIATWEILQNISKEQPMNRLLNGDVGSGKTVVAAIAALETAKSGYQVALMAPTEVLAKQHFHTFHQLLGNQKLNIALLVGSGQKYIGKKTNQIINISRPQLKKKISNQEIEIIIGTHALIQKDVKFSKLALAIIDEQHRFGVKQRAALQQTGFINNKKQNNVLDKKTIPHLLTITATPIPRTLALTIYGDLDISLLKEKPNKEQKTITKLVAPSDRTKAYQFIKQQIKKGRQAFVICPLIEESEKLEVKSVTQEYEKLTKNVFPNFNIAMLHGRLKPSEKEKIMKDFKYNKINILVSTSVVEVGIDVPNATVMIIEGAERFGLAQIHQFRGRIGRSNYKSYCFIFSNSNAKKTLQRLKALLKYNDGFKLAEKDLEIRGPGDIYGNRQWGLPDLAMASLSNLELVQKVRKEAEMLLDQDIELKKYPLLKEKFQNFKDKIHFE